MTIKVPLNLDSETEIRRADQIIAIDPRIPGFREVLAGGGLVPPYVDSNAQAYEVRILEIEVDSTNDNELNTARTRIQEVRGDN